MCIFLEQEHAATCMCSMQFMIPIHTSQKNDGSTITINRKSERYQLTFMEKDTRTSLTVTVFILLFILNILLQMLLSGEPLGRLFSEVFTTVMGFFNLISAIVVWFFNYFFTSRLFYLLGFIIALEFLVLPLMVRYRYISFKPNLFVSVLGAFYIWLVFRIMAVIFG